MPEVTSDFSLEEYISSTMIGLGVPAHLKGYRYLRSAILIATKDMQVVGSVTKLLYPEVAKLYQTTNSKVERAIRNAIEISWERGNANLFEELYGYSNKDGHERPTNSEYIANIADQIQLRLRENASELINES
ncbi:MAG: sporulation initiation factor Spo0A C-terminal domain-containing protein [Lachnospiraceae bacterium]|nr:sporulation initiation factor Spo0A C-terminal domain-containing protein [Lachnospiraceae bacterium]